MSVTPSADRETELAQVRETELALQRAAVSEAELRAADVEVELLREREQKLVALLEEARHKRDDAEHLIKQMRASLSWRLTQPLRAAKRLAGRHR